MTVRRMILLRLSGSCAKKIQISVVWIWQRILDSMRHWWQAFDMWPVILLSAWMMTDRHRLMKWANFWQRSKPAEMWFTPNIRTSSILHFAISAVRSMRLWPDLCWENRRSCTFPVILLQSALLLMRWYGIRTVTLM